MELISGHPRKYWTAPVILDISDSTRIGNFHFDALYDWEKHSMVGIGFSDLKMTNTYA